MRGIPLSGVVYPERQNEPTRRPALVGQADQWLVAFAATLIPLSLIWDFSWESSIGVDRFWSPPHLATQAGVWLCGILLTAFTTPGTAFRTMCL